MSERTETIAHVTRWSLFLIALPISAFVSMMGWVGTGFGALADAIPLLLVLPMLASAVYSFRLAAAGLATLLAIHILLQFRFGLHHFAWDDLAPSKIDYCFWIVVILIATAAWTLKFRSSESR